MQPNIIKIDLKAHSVVNKLFTEFWRIYIYSDDEYSSSYLM